MCIANQTDTQQRAYVQRCPPSVHLSKESALLHFGQVNPQTTDYEPVQQQLSYPMILIPMAAYMGTVVNCQVSCIN